MYAAVSHGLLTGPANERIDESPIERLFMTDSVETQPHGLPEKVEVVSVAGLFGEAIRRIANREWIPGSLRLILRLTDLGADVHVRQNL